MPRSISLFARAAKPGRIYTDAVSRGHFVRLGVLAFVDMDIFCSSLDVPLYVIANWTVRKQYTNLGELLAGPVVAYALADQVRGRDVLWFIDNTTALSTLHQGRISHEGWQPHGNDNFIVADGI